MPRHTNTQRYHSFVISSSLSDFVVCIGEGQSVLEYRLSIFAAFVMQLIKTIFIQCGFVASF